MTSAKVVVDLQGAKFAALEERRRELIEEIEFLAGANAPPMLRRSTAVKAKLHALKLVEEAMARLGDG